MATVSWRGLRFPTLPALPLSRRMLVIVVVVILAVPGAWLLARGPAVDDNALVARVKRGPFVVSVTTSGELRARQFVQITAPAGAQQAGAYQMKIQSIVPEGTIVKQGDVVAELDRSTLANKLAEVTLALQKAEAQYEQAMLDSTLTLSTARENIRTMELQLEEKRLAREQAVYEAPTVRRQAEIEHERAERALAQARSDYDTKTEQARAKMREVGADLQRQRNLLKVVQDVMAGFTIRAPAPGMVMPPAAGPLGAMTAYTLYYAWKCRGERFEFHAIAGFRPRASWVKRAILNDPEQRRSALVHEQTHFDLTELHARIMRRRFAEVGAPCRKTDAELQALARQLAQDEKTEQRRYDKETDNGRLDGPQAAWTDAVTRRLAILPH